MSKLDLFSVEEVPSELVLEVNLKILRNTVKQQLEDTKRRQLEELEKRIFENAVLSTKAGAKYHDEKELNHKPRNIEMRGFNSTSALISTNEASHNHQHRSYSSFRALDSATGTKLCSVRAPVCDRCPSSKTTQRKQEEEAKSDSRRKLSAVPVPSHVVQPVYQQMMELREKERTKSHEQRKQFMLSLQKPFSFEEREKSKREKLILEKQSHDPENLCDRKPQHVRKESVQIKEKLKVAQKAQQHVKKQQENPEVMGGPKMRVADRTRERLLGILDERPSFQPKILHQVPNFSKLHRELQTELLRKNVVKEELKCQPFLLRTSTRPARKSVKSPEVSQTSKMRRSKSLGSLLLMSANTLPTYITDAVRLRHNAIRESMEIRDNQNKASSDFLKTYQKRTGAMKKSVAVHAKLHDPHTSLKDVLDKNLKHHQQADLQRMKNYMRELKEIKVRVSARPFLFEQVKQKDAKVRAEQQYINVLNEAGLKEQFVKENGESYKSDESDTDSDIHRTKTEMQSREENVDDGEKIEDVDKDSVKSKGEEMP